MTAGPVPPGTSADHDDEDATTAPHASTTSAGIPAGITVLLGRIEEAARALAATDWAGMPGAVTDEVIRSMERLDAAQAAIRGAAYSAFEHGLEHVTYAQRAMTGYLTAETGTTRAGARAECAWMRRHDRHRAVMAKLAVLEVMAPMAARICGWTDQLPDEFVSEADQILLTAHAGGLRETGLARLAAQMRQALCPEDDDKEPGRGVSLETTIDGAGVIHGDLDPGCAALVQAAFDHYGQKDGPEDQRTHPERMHDALAAICREVLSLPATPPGDGHDEADSRDAEDDLFTSTGDGTDTDGDTEDFTGDSDDRHSGDGDDADAGPGNSGRAPGGAVVTATGHAPAASHHAGQAKGRKSRKGRRRRVPVRALVHLNMCDIIVLPGAPALQQAWAAAAAEQVAGERAAAWEQPGDGGMWLSGPQASAFLQDALVTPVVTGRIDASVIPRLAAAGALLHQALTTSPDGQDQAEMREATRKLVMDMLAEAVALMSGPAGYASYLRTRFFQGTILGADSLPLDIGASRYVPPHLRTLLTIRDRGCAFPGGCTRPARDCEPHHTPPLSEGGQTKLDKMTGGCWWHHHHVVHKLGWRIDVNPDGTTTTYRPDGTRHVPGTPPRRPPPQPPP